MRKTADTEDGVCDADSSLREAIAAVGSGKTVIIPTGVYTLTLGLELTIDKNLTLTGLSADQTIIQADVSSGTASYRVFFINSGNTVVISRVTIRHGDTNTGGGIRNEGVLTLTDCTVFDNDGGNAGGGIYSF